MVMPLHTFLNGWSTRAYQDSLLGNPNDTLSLYNVSTQPVDSINIRRDLPWRLLSLVPTLTVRKLTMEAGASLDVANVLLDITTGINLAGTPTLPITLKSTSTACWSSSPCSIGFSGTATSRLSNVVITNAMLNSSGSHVLHLDQVRANAAITLGSIGSSITNAVIEDVRVTSVGPNGALFLRASAVRAQNVMVRRTASPLAGVLIEGSNVEVLTCDVTDNVGDGIRILSGSGIQIHDCNLERNTGAGVNNQGTFLVDARRNWWGDPAGALGPNGDGVMGVVDHSEARLTRR